MDKKTLLHYLRSPYNINVDDMREARFQAADELERLYALEECVKELIAKMEKHETSFCSKVNNQTGGLWSF